MTSTPAPSPLPSPVFYLSTMSTLGQDPRLECQICFHFYSSRRRPKLLGCGHTCCSVCLRHMFRGRLELACPWCRALTPLPAGLTVSQLPDDPQALPLLAQHTPVFMRLPGDNRCYLLPLAMEADAPLLSTEFAPCLVRASQWKDVTVVTAANNQMLNMERERGEDERDEQDVKQSRWTGFCTLLLVVIIFLFLLAVIFQNVACISKPFTIIRCG